MKWPVMVTRTNSFMGRHWRFPRGDSSRQGVTWKIRCATPGVGLSGPVIPLLSVRCGPLDVLAERLVFLRFEASSDPPHRYGIQAVPAGRTALQPPEWWFSDRVSTPTFSILVSVASGWRRLFSAVSISVYPLHLGSAQSCGKPAIHFLPTSVEIDPDQPRIRRRMAVHISALHESELL